MVSFEDMESCIQEWFSDHHHEGVCGIAKVYATIMMEAEKQLEFFGKLFNNSAGGQYHDSE